MTGPRSVSTRSSNGGASTQLVVHSSRPPSQVYTRGTIGAVKAGRSPHDEESRISHHRSLSQTRHETVTPRRNQHLSRDVNSVYSADQASVSTSNSRSRRSGSHSRYEVMAPELAKLHVKVARRVVEGK